MQRTFLQSREQYFKTLGPTLIPWPDHPYFYDLIDGADIFSGGLIMRMLCLHLDLAGRAYLYKQRNGLRKPVAVWPIPPFWVTRRPSLDESYPFYELRFRVGRVEVPKSEIIAFLDPDPLQPYSDSAGPGLALGDETNTAEALSKMLSSYYENRAIPPMVIMPKIPIMGVDAREKLKVREGDWIERTQSKLRRGIPYFSSVELIIKELAGKFQENQLVELLHLNWDIHRQTLGEPPEVLGDLRKTSRSEIGAAYELHARLNLVPRLDYACRVFQTQLIERDYDDRLILSYESPIDRDSEYRLRMLAYAPEAMVIDEIREMGHWPPDPSGQGRVLRIMRKGTSFGRLVETLPDQKSAPAPVTGSGNGHDRTAQAVIDLSDPDLIDEAHLREALMRYIELASPEQVAMLTEQLGSAGQ